MSAPSSPTNSGPQFPIHPIRHMPCPHWQHFPISPESETPPSPIYSVFCEVCQRTVSTRYNPSRPELYPSDPRAHHYSVEYNQQV